MQGAQQQNWFVQIPFYSKDLRKVINLNLLMKSAKEKYETILSI